MEKQQLRIVPHLLGYGLIYSILLIVIHQLRDCLIQGYGHFPEPWFMPDAKMFMSALFIAVLYVFPYSLYKKYCHRYSKLHLFIATTCSLLLFCIYYVLIGYHRYPGFFNTDVTRYVEASHYPRSVVVLGVFLFDIFRAVLLLSIAAYIILLPAFFRLTKIAHNKESEDCGLKT